MANDVIIKGIGGFYYIYSDGEVFECRARGVFRKNNIKPLPGDIVKFDRLSGNVEEILSRRNEFLRPAVSNIDTVVVVISSAKPAPDLYLVDKITVLANVKEIECAVCVNKSDVFLDDIIVATYENAGFKTFVTSAEKRDGLRPLLDFLEGKVSIFCGNSGVGKSTLLNSLAGKPLMETGVISSKIERGKHTTRHVEFFELSKGTLVADTPGFSILETPQYEHIAKEELELLFSEFEPYLGKCRFSGCAHKSEPDCAVKEAVKDGKVSESRYKSYCMLYDELSLIKKWEQK